MTSNREGYLLVCLILLACGSILAVGNQPARAARAAPPLPTNLAAVTPPAPAPPFSLLTLKGTAMRSADLQGKVVVIRFWATW